MRHLYLISYDIACPKRWRQVYKIVNGFGDAVHYSVFSCCLSKPERILLLEQLLPVMNQNEDRLMVADLGPADSCAMNRVEFYGTPPRNLSSPSPVIV